MYSEKTAIAIVCVLALLAVLVIGTSNMTGNVVMDAGSATSPVVGAFILVAFLVATIWVLKGLMPEGRYHQ